MKRTESLHQLEGARVTSENQLFSCETCSETCRSTLASGNVRIHSSLGLRSSSNVPRTARTLSFQIEKPPFLHARGVLVVGIDAALAVRVRAIRLV